MDYRVEEKKSFSVLTKVKEFRNEIISDEGNTEIPDFWSECDSSGVFDVLNACCKDEAVYGLCSPLTKESDYFKYGIGKLYTGGDIPKGFEAWEVKPTLWAVFSCIGSNGDCIHATWDRIHTEFLPSSGYTMLDDTDFELYPTNSGELFCEIWIPVEKKLN